MNDIIDLDKGRCRHFGCNNRTSLEVHHIISRSKSMPGREEPWNKITLCHTCHTLVTDRKLSNVQLLEEIQDEPDFRWRKALDWCRLVQGIKDFKFKDQE